MLPNKLLQITSRQRFLWHEERFAIMFKSTFETHLSVDRTTHEHPCHGTAKEVFQSQSPEPIFTSPKVPLCPLAASPRYVFAAILPLSITPQRTGSEST